MAARVESFHLHMTPWTVTHPHRRGTWVANTAESRHGDATTRGWVRQAVGGGRGQRATDQGEAYRGRVEGAGHPGTQAPWNFPPPSTRLLLALIMSLDGYRCGVESPSRRLPFCSTPNPSSSQGRCVRRARAQGRLGAFGG